MTILKQFSDPALDDLPRRTTSKNYFQLRKRHSLGETNAKSGFEFETSSWRSDSMPRERVESEGSVVSQSSALLDPPDKEDTDDSAFRKLWGRSGSWMVSGKVPSNSEEPRSVRKNVQYPTRDSDSDFLQQWGVGAVTGKGSKKPGDRSVGQDNFSVSALANGWEAFCVTDGHGQGGHWPATRAAHVLPHVLQCGRCTALLRQGQVEKALQVAFQLAQDDLARVADKKGIDLNLSGCAACVALRHPEKRSVWVATVGDTRAALLVPGIGAVLETADHKPSKQAERERIESSGGEVRSRVVPSGHLEERVYMPGRFFPALNMTRSLGDLVGKNCGIICAPDVVEWSVDRLGEALLLIASDGVWEFLESRRVAEIVLGAIKEGLALGEAVEQLRQKAADEWQSHEGTYCDDITAVCVPLSGPAAPRLKCTSRTGIWSCFRGLFKWGPYFA